MCAWDTRKQHFYVLNCCSGSSTLKVVLPSCNNVTFPQNSPLCSTWSPQLRWLLRCAFCVYEGFSWYRSAQTYWTHVLISPHRSPNEPLQELIWQAHCIQFPICQPQHWEPQFVPPDCRTGWDRWKTLYFSSKLLTVDEKMQGGGGGGGQLRAWSHSR